MKEVMNRPDVKENISKKCKGLNSGILHPMFGKHHKPESIEKMKTTLTIVMNDPAVKQKISDSVKKAFENDPTLYGKCSKARLGKEFPMKGKHHTPETIEKIKESLANMDPEIKRRKIEAISGEKNPHWCGGISYLPYGFKFDSKLKRRIRERDGNVCQLCFLPNKEHKEKFKDSLHCHHIDHDKQNCEEYNLITLCNVCNGKVNKDKKHWTQYFQTLLSVVDEQDYLEELYANN